KTAAQEVALSELATEFINKSQTQKRHKIFLSMGVLALVPTVMIAGYLIFDEQIKNMLANMLVNIYTEILLAQRNCEPTPQLKDLLEHQRENGRTNWERIHLCGKALNGINFEGAQLSRANFRDARLNVANLGGAILYKADFEGAWLISANLSYADLSRSNLTGADLDRAILRETTLQQVDLTNTKNLTKEQIESAILCQTKLPNHIVESSPYLENRDCEDAE
ncbi:pentapeptide repeat-containing protein, partial [Limnospira fusiformis]|uniref:pentapeptide repeat-containing protein n=1 Tax=Limnospira fusiformis TaxID=54297 RepID=UPI002AA239AB|nr:pentapeptide repeat-containing protein [Limnospira fusiformis LS22]